MMEGDSWPVFLQNWIQKVLRVGAGQACSSHMTAKISNDVRHL